MGDTFKHKKSLGQNFLNSDVVPSWMCDAADVSKQDTVVEIGPGTGALTAELLARGARVIALEADERAIAVLRERFREACQSGQLIIHHQDARTLDFGELSLDNRAFKVVANIPYYLSGLLFRTCLSQAIKPNLIVFLVQKEVAKRIASDSAKGEKESLLSLSVKAYGIPQYIKTVSRGHFTPSPAVDSGIIAVRNISNEHFHELDEDLFFVLLHLGFGQKRKQLMGNLAAQYDRKQIEAVFTQLGIPAHVRAEDLPLATWLALTQALYTS
ncbi:MAG: 16S rRNA (adenine(1518)-N(6)/adenine(1519)-N(6))-dimethyltransferase RsmA [Candidatus Paceibacterota bacterium]